MKRFIFAIMLAAAIAIPADGQTPTPTTPQSVTQANVLNGVTAATTTGCLNNLGQNVHFAFYSAGGATGSPTNVQIRIEGSYNSDSATCSTGTWFAISDDGTTPNQNGNNLIFGIGTFPFLRINLVKCSCDAADTISASYTGTSSSPGNPFGAYGAGQQIRKVAFMLQAGGSVTSPTFVTPYGSTAGFLVVVGSAVFTAGSISARCVDGVSSSTSMTLPTTASSLAFPVVSSACNLVNVRCQACALSGGTFSAIWFFYPPGAALPGGAQPSNTSNSEVTSGANASVAVTLTASSIGQRGHLFKVNARCSAGTAQLTVADGATQIYSTAATEVGTTSFKDSWPVGLASTAGNNLVITLGTCGVANTGTLDVQGSVF